MKHQTRKTRTSLALLLSFSLLTGVGACVTVNVNFPESAVQKATDDYVRELYKARDRKGQPAAEPSASPSPTSAFFFPQLIAEAYADDVLKMDSPAIKAIQKDQIDRLDAINIEKRAGNLGESNKGLLEIRTEKKLLMPKLQKLSSAENKAREKLFQELVKLNPPMPEAQVRKNFARSFQTESSPSGTWVQSADGEWSRKP